jgi:hypothetical protein
MITDIYDGLFTSQQKEILFGNRSNQTLQIYIYIYMYVYRMISLTVLFRWIMGYMNWAVCTSFLQPCNVWFTLP